MVNGVWLRTAILAVAAAMAVVVPAQTDRPTDQEAQYEVWFMENLIDHQAEAIQAASLAPGRTANMAVLNAASSVVANRSAQIVTLQGWLENWYGVQYWPNPGQGAELNALSSLVGTGFDQAFVTWLGNHNATTVDASRQAASWAFHPALGYAAGDIAESEATEIRQLQAMSWTPYTAYGLGNGTVYVVP